MIQTLLGKRKTIVEVSMISCNGTNCENMLGDKWNANSCKMMSHSSDGNKCRHDILIVMEPSGTMGILLCNIT